MATPKIILNISNGQITATAVDQNGNTIPGGDLHMNPSGVIHWSHAADAEDLKQFVVRFLDAGNNESWPFQSPPEPTDGSKRLLVRHNKLRVTKLANVTNVDWRYKVAMSGYTELDPMIIIRGRAKVSTIAVLVAVIGALAVAGLLSWWFFQT